MARTLALGSAASLVFLVFLAVFAGLGYLSWYHLEWALGLTATATMGWACVLRALEAQSQRYSSREQTQAAVGSAIVVTGILQWVGWHQAQLTEAFRQQALVVGVAVEGFQLDLNRALLSAGLAFLFTGGLLAVARWAVIQARRRPAESSVWIIPTVCLVVGLGVLAFLAGRSRALVMG